jgi:hypothetical protein
VAGRSDAVALPQRPHGANEKCSFLDLHSSGRGHALLSTEHGGGPKQEKGKWKMHDEVSWKRQLCQRPACSYVVLETSQIKPYEDNSANSHNITSQTNILQTHPIVFSIALIQLIYYSITRSYIFATCSYYFLGLC